MRRPPTSPQDDIARAQRGDRAALERVLTEQYEPVLRVTRRVCGEGGDDAAQAALLSIAGRISSFRSEAAFATWCHAIAVRAALDELRRAKRRPVPTEADDDGAVLASSAWSGTLTDRVEQRLDIDAALAQLSEDFRAVLVLRDLCDLDYAEIAEVLSIPPGTVRSRLARARRAMVDLLSPDGAGTAASTPDVKGDIHPPSPARQDRT